jgi:hypothetical protein
VIQAIDGAEAGFDAGAGSRVRVTNGALGPI